MNCTHRSTKVVAATRVVVTLALALILVGCTGPTAVVSPTQDIPTVRTEAASTVIAKITIEAALNPTATAAVVQAPTEAATATTAPTATQPSAATPTPLATFTPFPTQSSSGSSSGGGTGIVYPTATRRAGPDQAQFITQDPKDGTVFHAGEEFDGTWTFKNIGTSTWNTNYRIRVANNGKGTVISKANLYKLQSEVKPGESIRVFADMVAPSSAGRYVSYWELCNDNGDIFYAYYLVVDVK